MPESNGVPLAIVGLACRFPGDASNLSRFWDMLKDGRDAYSSDSTRWNSDAFYHANKDARGTVPTRGGHFIKADPYAFDAAFFSLTASEAIGTDPRQRMALEVAYEAFENAGLPMETTKGRKAAVCIGASYSDYEAAIRRDVEYAPRYAGVGTTHEILSNRISHFFDLHGPSMTVETACSSSLVAVHLACQSIRGGEADMAVAGGVHCILNPDGTIMVANLSFLSSGGRSRSFDEAGDGYGRGEGCGMVIIKKLADAERDGDPIRAIIRGSGVNSDGWTQGITLPNAKAQQALIRDVYDNYGLNMASTQFVECHGTGTKVGDPAEMEAIYKSIGQKASPSSPLIVGSVKPNIGHLEPSAGIAGLIKGVLAMENGMIPPQIHLNKLNTSIPFEEWNVLVPRKLTPWPVTEVKQMSVSSFGMGGTNAHVVLEGNRRAKGHVNLVNGQGNRDFLRKTLASDKKRLYAFSASDRAGIERVAKSLAEDLETFGPAAFSPEHLANLAYTLGERRSKLSWKITCFADNGPELCENLEKLKGDGAVRSWPGMGVALLDRTVFRESVTKSAKFLKKYGCKWDPIGELKRPASESRLAQPQISQPICTVLQIALVDELRTWGVRPVKCVGHSSGEIGAAYAIGALSHQDAIAVAYFRGQASSSIAERCDLKGGMMAVGLSREEAERYIAKVDTGKIGVACVNSPQSVTISGDISAIDQLLSTLEKDRVFARKLKVGVAYHSHHMSEIVSDYLASIAEIESRGPAEGSAQMISSVTGDLVDPEQLGAYYWARNLTSPVEFADALVELVTGGALPNEHSTSSTVDMLLELGPHSALGGPIQQILDASGIKDVTYACMIERNKDGTDTALDLAANLFTRGAPLNMQGVNDDFECKTLTTLSPYPWNHSKTFHAESRMGIETLMRKQPRKSLIGIPMPTMSQEDRMWRGLLSFAEEPWIRDHKGLSTVLFPASGMVCMILEAAQQMVDPAKAVRAFKLRDVAFMAAMPMHEDTSTEVIIHVRPHIVSTAASNPHAWWEFTITSCKVGDQVLFDNCRGLMMIDYAGGSEQMNSELAHITERRIAGYSEVVKSCPHPIAKSVFYELAQRSSWFFGPLFRSVDNMRLGKDKYTYDVFVKDYGQSHSNQLVERPFLIHPAMLDAVFQIPDRRNDAGDHQLGIDKAIVPVSVGELEITSNIPADVGTGFKAYCTTKRQGLHNSDADVCWLDENLSEVYLSVQNLCRAEVAFTPEGATEISKGSETSDLCAVVHWDYALDFLKPDDMKTILATVPPEEATARMARLFLHEQPGTKILELVPDSDTSKAAMSTALDATTFPGQVRYAVPSRQSEVIAAQQSEAVTDILYVGNADDALPATTDAADLIIVSPVCDTMIDFETSFEKILHLAKSDATVICTASTECTGSILAENGYSSSRAPALYSQRAKVMTNGVKAKPEVVIIVSPTAGDLSKKLFAQLRDILTSHGFEVKSITWDKDLVVSVQDKLAVSLLETETSFLETLSETDFDLLKHTILKSKRLLWLTYGDDPVYNMVDGFSRVIREEIAGTHLDVLHLSQATGLEYGASLTARILTTESKDAEWRESDGIIKVGRLSLDHKQNETVDRHLNDWTGVMPLKEHHGPLRLTVGKPGLLDTLHFIDDDRWVGEPLHDGEVEIEVKASGLNFRDVMISMGVLSDSLLGFEVGGVVRSVGSKVTRIKPGDHVAALASGAHASLLRTKEFVCAKIPDDLSFETAAAVSVVHATAYHALVNLAKLRRGQSVLIHAAAGGVGQAAIQLAKHLDLLVYATVGSAEKRKLLVERYDVNPEWIFTSRDASFVHGIKRVTNGRGVDCILNSLSGELLRQSWYCLATFGIFIELGLRDVVGNTRLEMKPFMQNTTFTLFNLVTVTEQMPEQAAEMFDAVHDLIRQGILTAPYSLTSYPLGEAENAFRVMQSGRHLGKLVLVMGEEDKVPILHQASYSLKLDPKVTYLLVGGLGGLGRSLADPVEAKKTIAELYARQGVRVKVYKADVSDSASFTQAMTQCEAELPPVKGVVQMAMVLRDALFEKMTFSDWTDSVRPKVRGTRNIHEYFTSQRPLDFMILFSSCAGLLGNPGQANYAAGNTYQDELARHRCKQGLRAVSVDLGIMRDVGVLAETGAKGNVAVWEKAIGIREPVFHALMRSVINQQNSGAKVDLAQLGTGLPTADALARYGLARPQLFDDPRMARLALATVPADGSVGTTGASDSIGSRLEKADSIDATTMIIAGALVQKTADMLQMEASDVNPQKPLSAYGVDSLVAIEVRNWISREMKTSIPLLDILAAVPMDKLAAKIAHVIRPPSS
ncbi:MAG: Type I Iterative PKS [Chrysothrix sp. TS-e1954]|nr:MAG: Type I Iterative PKS [Chrysothrix sp. TS-e1954]